MTPNERPPTLSPGQLAEAFEDLVAGRRADYRDELIGRVRATRQRPAWTFIERWLPMTLVTARPATAPPLRVTRTLILAALLTAALATSLVLAGSLLLRDGRADPRLGVLLVPTLELDEGWDGEGLAGLSIPMGLDVGPDGNLYVANTGTNEIVVLDSSGDELRRWGGTGSDEGKFIFQRNPSEPLDALGGLAVTAEGVVYVTDTANDRVQRFTADGGSLGGWGGHGAEDGRFLEPTDVAVGPDGSVYVVDDLRDDIQRFTAEGEWLQTIGRHGPGDGEMDFTGGIAVDPSGVLLNADFGNGRVQAWDSDGTFLWSKGGPRDPNALRNPTDVDVDDEGRVIVADEAGIKVFTDGPLAASSLVLPMSPGPSVAVGGADDVYLSAPGQDRVLRFRIALQEEAAAVMTAIRSSEPHQSSPIALASQPSPVPGGPETVVTDSIFPVAFSALLPSTLSEPGGHPGWWRQDLLPGAVSFQYVRDAERTPAYVNVYLVEGVFADPCHPEDGLATPDEPTVDDLVEALTHQPGVRATPVTEIAFGEHRGMTFDLANSIDTRSCADTTWLAQWTYRASASSDEVTNSQGLPNSHQRIAIVDVDGVPILIESWEVGANREEVLEANALFESIRFQ